MAGPITKKLKTPYIHRLNPKFAVNTTAEEKRRQKEAWQVLNQYITQQGAFVVTPPGRMLRIEFAKDSTLPAKLTKLGFNVWNVGQNTRLTPFGFLPVDVIEISLDGK